MRVRYFREKNSHNSHRRRRRRRLWTTENGFCKNVTQIRFDKHANRTP